MLSYENIRTFPQLKGRGPIEAWRLLEPVLTARQREPRHTRRRVGRILAALISIV